MKQREVTLGVALVVLIWAFGVLWGALPSQAGAAEPKGKIIVAVSTLQEETPDPHRTTGSLLRPLHHHIGEGLVQRDLEGNRIGGLAESWELSPDGKTWHFILRKGVKFHDGETMTAEDAKWSLDRILEMKHMARFRDIVDRVEIVDENHIAVHTKNPDPFYVLETAYDLRIASKKYYDKVGDEQFTKQPVAAGPFKFVTQKIGQFVEFEGFADFYDPARVPTVKTVIMKIIPEASTQLAMLKTGEADIIEAVSGPAVQEVKGSADLKIASSAQAGQLSITFCDLIHPEPSPVKDKRVRQALAYAIDRKPIIDKIFFGEASIQVVGDHGSITFGFDPSLKPYPYDPEKAKALLKEAGYPDGFEVDLLSYVSSSTPSIPETIEAVAGFWKKIGVKAKLQQIEAGQYFGQWRDKKLRGIAPISYFPPTDAGVMDQTMFKTGGSYSYYSNPLVDELLEKQGVEMDLQKREMLLQEICRHVHEELPRIALVHANTIFGLGPRVKEWKLQKGMLPFCVGLERVVLK